VKIGYEWQIIELLKLRRAWSSRASQYLPFICVAVGLSQVLSSVPVLISMDEGSSQCSQNRSLNPKAVSSLVLRVRTREWSSFTGGMTKAVKNCKRTARVNSLKSTDYCQRSHMHTVLLSDWRGGVMSVTLMCWGWYLEQNFVRLKYSAFCTDQNENYFRLSNIL